MLGSLSTSLVAYEQSRNSRSDYRLESLSGSWAPGKHSQVIYGDPCLFLCWFPGSVPPEPAPVLLPAFGSKPGAMFATIVDLKGTSRATPVCRLRCGKCGRPHARTVMTVVVTATVAAVTRSATFASVFFRRCLLSTSPPLLPRTASLSGTSFSH